MKTALLFLAFAIYFCVPGTVRAQINAQSKISSYGTVANQIIKAAKIQNCVKNIIGIIKSGVTAKNLNKPGA